MTTNVCTKLTLRLKSKIASYWMVTHLATFVYL